MSSLPPRFLVTAGSTREKIDDVRDWGNIFTGNTGYDIARELAAFGEVDLLTSNAGHLQQIQVGLGLRHAVSATRFSSHAELRDELAALMATRTYDAVFMSAAVSDYSPARAYQVVSRLPGAEAGVETWTVRDAQRGKVRSSFDEIAILGRRTEKLVDLFRTEWKYRGLLFKFKLEVGVSREELIHIGRASRDASGADYLVANSLDMVTGEKAGAFLLKGDEAIWITREQLAMRLARQAASDLQLLPAAPCRDSQG
ncbi:MAG: hypothetical protein IT440_08790 [Phycisphaeraceae bacterium]|nr:hypothetical protein [Phycisphaeraceae bacterium]